MRGSPQLPLARVGSVEVAEISYEEIIRYRHWYDAAGLPLAHAYYDRLADFAKDRRHFYAAYLDGRVAGFSALSRHRRRADGRRAIYQRSSYTRTEYRRRGVWRAIWAHKIQQIGSRGWARPETLIWALTRPGDRRFEHYGFTLEGQCEREYLGRLEPFLIWTTSWSELLSHRATTPSPVKDAATHTWHPLQVRL